MTRCRASRRPMTKSAPRPLKLRRGFAVSTLTTTCRPRAADSCSSTNCGVLKKTGSIVLTASSMLARLRSKLRVLLLSEVKFFMHCFCLMCDCSPVLRGFCCKNFRPDKMLMRTHNACYYKLRPKNYLQHNLQFSMNPWRAPQRVGYSHLFD